ncbi:MAG: DUF4159 domain-containing protein [Myxococcales bacterium]|nr:DUF4159 domain-containing protein [Myxococcales bacterium]
MNAPRPWRRVTLWMVGASLALLWVHAPTAVAIGEDTLLDVRRVVIEGAGEAPRPTAARRLAWEVRQRTSVETRLEPTTVRLDDPQLFASPMLYWSGDQTFGPLSEAEVIGLRRFVEFGGFVLIDDASPDAEGFDRSVRNALKAVFGEGALRPLPETHTVYRSFYLLKRPYGRVEGPAQLEAVERGGRAAVVYSRHDLGGAWERDNLGNYRYQVQPGRRGQREMAIRLGVNLVLYALCLDYKDDQVHSPFIMRRRAGQK